MKVIRWGVVAGVALAAAAAAVVAAPSALAAGGLEAVGMSEHGTSLVAFNTANPQSSKVIGGITGMGNDKLVGIDFRPKNHELYGVGASGKIYVLDPRTAAAKQVGKLSVALSGASFDIDFTPAGDQLRIVSDTAQNIHQPFGATGPSGPTVVDGKLSRKNITSLAYDGGGRAIGIDTKKRQLLVLNPSSGAVTDLGTPNAFPVMASLSNGLDVAPGGSFAVVNLDHKHTLFSVNTANGTAKKIGVFPGHVTDLSLRR